MEKHCSFGYRLTMNICSSTFIHVIPLHTFTNRKCMEKNIAGNKSEYIYAISFVALICVCIQVYLYIHKHTYALYAVAVRCRTDFRQGTPLSTLFWPSLSFFIRTRCILILKRLFTLRCACLFFFSLSLSLPPFFYITCKRIYTCMHKYLLNAHWF